MTTNVWLKQVNQTTSGLPTLAAGLHKDEGHPGLPHRPLLSMTSTELYNLA